VDVSTRSLLVGIDLGTTVCKALVFDEELRVLSAVSRHLSLSTLSGTEIEQDAEGWWAAVQEVVREALRAPGCDARSVRGLSVSSQGISFVPVDASGIPLRPAFSWLDTRAIEQRRQILEKLGEERIFSITGKRCHETYLLPKLLWFRQNEPGMWRRCRRILMPLDFIIARLTGEYATDHTMASGTMLYDIAGQGWSSPILDAFDLDGEMLPEIRWGGTPVGGLRAGAAESLGLPRDLTVSMGGQDQKVAALGAGIDLKKCTISLGTAMAITQKCEKPVIDPRMRMPCFTDLLPGRWVLEGSAVCCSILDWAKETFFPGLSDGELNRMAHEAADRPHPPLLLPFFSGASAPFHDPGARGTLHGLDLSTTPGQIVRSIYEGIAFLVRANLEVIEKISRPVEGLRIFGGGSRSDVWCGIIADVVQSPVSALATPESASVGAAILAGMGSGVFKRVEDAFTHLAVRTSYEPRVQSASHYDGMYGEFQRLSGILLRSIQWHTG
jgi:xylulokinase